MNLLAMSGLVALALLVWWLLLQQLRAKPWLAQGNAIDNGFDATLQSPQLIALIVFIAVVTALFGLFAAAYHMRMAVPDWTHLPLPKILRVNTLLLAASSVALQWAWVVSARGNNFMERGNALQSEHALRHTEANNLRSVRHGLSAAAGLTLTFFIGQWLAWRQLDASGFYFSCTPASAFFYLLTGLHGAHLFGGVIVLSKTMTTVYRSDAVTTHRLPTLSIKLCALYWHYLLALWLALYALLAFT